MDYLGLSTILMFEACDRRHCVNITIVDDEVLERPVESFTVTLERTPFLDSRIERSLAKGEIVIRDNDGVFHNRHAYGVMSNVLYHSGCCGGSGEDTLPGPRGCGCGRSVCYCV